MDSERVQVPFGNQPVSVSAQTGKQELPIAMGQASPPQSHTLLLVVLTLIFFLAGGLVLAYFLIIQPKLDTYKTAKTASSYIKPVQKDISNVNGYLSKIYDIITGKTQDSSNNTLLRINTDVLISGLNQITQPKSAQGQVAGAETQSNPTNGPARAFLETLQPTLKSLQSRTGFGDSHTQVLGSTTQPIEAPRTTMLRQIKTEADGGNKAIKEANDNLTQLKNYIAELKDKPPELQAAISKIDENNKQVSQYFSESGKTYDYYYKISDLQIKLDPFLVSYVAMLKEVAQSSAPELFSERIKELKTTIDGLNSDVKNIDVSTLPKGLNDLHSDNLKVMEILVNNVSSVQTSLDQKSYLAFLTAIAKLQQELEPLTTRAVSLELNFWQNNTYLKDYQSFIDTYKKQDASLQELMKTNKLPFVTS